MLVAVARCARVGACSCATLLKHRIPCGGPNKSSPMQLNWHHDSPPTHPPPFWNARVSNPNVWQPKGHAQAKPRKRWGTIHLRGTNGCDALRGLFAIRYGYRAVYDPQKISTNPSIALLHCTTIYNYHVLNMCWAGSLQCMPRLALQDMAWLTLLASPWCTSACDDLRDHPHPSQNHRTRYAGLPMVYTGTR